jgi:hypothetical protein
MATKANKSTNNHVDAEIITRRESIIMMLVDQEPCDSTVKKRCKQIAKSVVGSIKKLTDFVMVKIESTYRSMPPNAFADEINGLKRLVKMMIEVINLKLKQQPKPA